MMKHISKMRGVAGTVLLCLMILSSLAYGQSVDFTPYLNARSVVSIWDSGSRIFGGLDEGGLVIWDRQDMDAPRRLVAGSGLSGNQIADMAWSGRHLWVATREGGLTRIGNPEGDLEFRQYSSNLGGLALTAVAATMLGESERVFYAMDGAGIGRIVDGLPGALYSAEQDGLIDNNVNALVFFQDQLFVATPSGISRFVNNAFTDVNDGLGNLFIYDLIVDTAGDLLAAGRGGVFRWDAEEESWTTISSFGSWALELSSGPLGTFGLGLGSGSAGIVRQLTGEEWVTLTRPYPRTRSLTAEHDLLIGGQFVPDGMTGSVGFGFLGRYDEAMAIETWQLEASLVRNANGITFGADGTPWIGSHNADALSNLQPEGWTSLYELASAENDSSGFINFGSNFLCMTTGTDGVIYGAQYTAGVVRYDPVAGRSHIMDRNNCGLTDGNVVNMVVHPAGPVFFLYDWHNEITKVDILLNPDQWRNPDSWISLPLGDGGLGTGPTCWDVLFERNDVMWFAMEGTGLVRWDLNSDLQGPEDPLTWQNMADDRWDDPVAEFSGTFNDPLETVALAPGPDGTMWVGGNGVTRISYGEFSRIVVVEEHFSQKNSPFGQGLVNGNVEDLAVDANGHLWVATRAGLNRGITEEGVTTFQAWFDLGNYLSDSSFASLYSPDAITLLPGGQYRKMLASPDGTDLLLSSDRGAVLIEPGAGSSGGHTTENLSQAYLYPNPFKPGEGQGSLKLGGLAADAVNGDPAEVQIYNLEGQLVFEDLAVSADVGFWDGRNISIERNDVTTGMYVVRVTFAGQSAVKTLAILR